MGEKMSSWASGSRTFVLHNASMMEHGGSESTCAMLLDAQLVPLLPKTLEAPPPDPAPPNFIIGDAGFKGAGMFVARDIPAGGLILVDQPAVVVPASAPFLRQTEAYDAMLPRLSQFSRDRLLALANCKPIPEYPAVEGIALTNAFQVSLPTPSDTPPEAKEYGGVFPDISRANHSCGLNIALKWDLQSFSVSMFAQRAMRTGEEVFNQYIDVLAPRAERRAQLARYGFACMCAHCDLPDDAAVARSDAARAELRDWWHLRPRFLPWSTDMCRADDAIIVSNLHALALIEQEGLYGLQVPFIEEIALSYAMLGDEREFAMWAQKVVDLCAGQDPPRAREFAGWIANARTFRQWGWRARQRTLIDKKKQTELVTQPGLLGKALQPLRHLHYIRPAVRTEQSGT